jgi:hypothetical protein
MEENKVTLEQVDKLYSFLQGELPEGCYCNPPKMSSRKAFTIIWFIQEFLRVIPETYERCTRCGNLFDTYNSGGNIRDRYYCDYCINVRDGEIRNTQQKYRERRKTVRAKRSVQQPKAEILLNKNCRNKFYKIAKRSAVR